MNVTSLFPFSVKVPRLRRGFVLDPMSGQETLGDWATATAVTVSDVLFAPGTSEEFPNVEIEAVSQYATLYMPLNADVVAGDRVHVDGSVWDVVGRRSNWGRRGRGPAGSAVPIKWVRDLAPGEG